MAGIEGGQIASAEMSWMDAFLGTIPGSMGETSALACLIGAASGSLNCSQATS